MPRGSRLATRRSLRALASVVVILPCSNSAVISVLAAGRPMRFG
jgi:hypothetical protein